MIAFSYVNESEIAGGLRDITIGKALDLLASAAIQSQSFVIPWTFPGITVLGIHPKHSWVWLNFPCRSAQWNSLKVVIWLM